MFLTKIIYFLLSYEINKTEPQMYYKIITNRKKDLCIEGNVTKKIAKTYNAIYGTCYEYNCTHFKKTYMLPFSGKVYIYNCN